MIYVIGLVLAAVSFGLIYYPLLRGRPLTDDLELPGEDGHRAADLVSRREATYEAIKELDFEHELGNLSEQDYRELRERYKWRAAEVLQALDGLGESLVVPDEAARQGSLPPAPAAGEEPAPPLGRTRGKGRPAVGTPCPECGEPTRTSSQFCPRCGAPLVHACPECGEPAALDDRFCGRCGTALGGGDDARD